MSPEGTPKPEKKRPTLEDVIKFLEDELKRLPDKEGGMASLFGLPPIQLTLQEAREGDFSLAKEYLQIHIEIMERFLPETQSGETGGFPSHAKERFDKLISLRSILLD